MPGMPACCLICPASGALRERYGCDIAIAQHIGFRQVVHHEQLSGDKGVFSRLEILTGDRAVGLPLKLLAHLFNMPVGPPRRSPCAPLFHTSQDPCRPGAATRPGRCSQPTAGSASCRPSGGRPRNRDGSTDAPPTTARISFSHIARASSRGTPTISSS